MPRLFSCPLSSVLCPLLLLLSSVLCPLTYSAEIRFKTPVRCTESSVRLSDLAEIVPADETLGSLQLFPAPAVGGQRVVSVSQIRDLLGNQGVSSLHHTFRGADRVTIYGPESLVLKAKNEQRSKNITAKTTRKAEEELTEALTTYLNRCTTDGRPENAIPWSITLRLNGEQTRLLADGGAILGMYGGTNPLVGEQEFQAELEGINPANGRRTLVRFVAEIALPPQVAVAKRSLSKGKVLNENDIEMVYRADLRGTDFFRDPNEVIGKSVASNIREKAVISSGMIESPKLVRKGEVVTVYARAPGIVVTGTAKALDDGAKGELITLEQLQKPKTERGRNASRDREDSTFVARVCGIGTVEVFATAGGIVRN